MTGRDLIFYGLLMAGGFGAAILGVPGSVTVSATLAIGVVYAVFASEPPPRPWPRSGAAAPAPDSPFEVRCDDETVRVTLDGAPREEVRWNDLRLVGIRIDDSYLPQPWWVLAGGTGGCMYPSDARGWENALHVMGKRLPRFDHEAVIRAMGMLEGGVVVWRHPSASDTHPKP